MIELKASEKANVAEVINHLLNKAPDMETQITFIQKARQESQLEGKLEGKQETARQLLAKGFTPSLIAEVTGLSETEIAHL